MQKITKRMMFEAIVNYVENGNFEIVMDEENLIQIPLEDLKDFAENEIALLDKKAAKAKETAARKKNETDELADIVAQVLTDEFEPIADIAARVAEAAPDATIAKVTYRLNKLVNLGIAVKEPIKVGGEDGKKARTVQGFKLVDAE